MDEQVVYICLTCGAFWNEGNVRRKPLFTSEYMVCGDEECDGEVKAVNALDFRERMLRQAFEKGIAHGLRVAKS